MAKTVEKSFWIAATPEALFHLYTNGEAAKAWLGLELTIEPFEGGRYVLDMNLGGISEGQVLELERPARIHHTVSDTGEGRGGHIRLTLEEEGGGTRLTLLHSGFADGAGAAYASRTWDHHLARLAIAATGGYPGPDPLLKDLGALEL